jgi:hypothetical protein
MDKLLTKLIRRGDLVAIEQGRIVIDALSSTLVPKKWIDSHRLELAREIARLTNDEILYFHSYKTGYYGKHLSEGVTLQFIGLANGHNFYTVFNASLKRTRTTSKHKAGTPLPDGQFRVNKSSKFYAFWLATGLNTPSRLSVFHDYMGNLRKVLFTANCDKGDRLKKDSIQPYTISCQELKSLILPNNSQTISRQQPYNIQTSKPYKQSEQTQQHQQNQAISATSKNDYGISTQGSADTRTTVIPIDNASYDEWLSDYSEHSDY